MDGEGENNMEQLGLFQSENPKKEQYQPNKKDGINSRTLKIEEDGDYWKGNIKPKIRLRGCWLARAGFKPGNHVSVKSIAHGIIELRSSDAALVLNETP